MMQMMCDPSDQLTNTRYTSDKIISPENLLALPELWLDIPPMWVSTHDLAREGWELKVHSRGGVSDSAIKDYAGRTHVHLRRSFQKNYGIRLTIPGRVRRVSQLWDLLTSRNYTSTLGLTIKCLKAVDRGVEDAIKDYGWSTIMDARLRMVARENPDLWQHVEQPEPPQSARLISLTEAIELLKVRREAEASGVVVPLRKAG